MSRIEALLDKYVDEPHCEDCLNFIAAFVDLFNTSRGTTVKHQPWPGGYRDHITEVMEIALVTYRALEKIRPLPFSLSDALLCCFLHDIEKVWKHALREGDKKDVDKDKILKEMFNLNDDHRNAIKYAHGEGEDYHPTDRIQGPLAAFVHHCDNTSARIWFDMPGPLNRSIPPETEVLLLMERYAFSLQDIESMPPKLQRKLFKWAKKRLREESE